MPIGQAQIEAITGYLHQQLPGATRERCPRMIRNQLVSGTLGRDWDPAVGLWHRADRPRRDFGRAHGARCIVASIRTAKIDIPGWSASPCRKTGYSELRFSTFLVVTVANSRRSWEMRTVFALVITLGLAVVQLDGQTATITNADVLQMTKAGLGADLIVAAIHGAQTKKFDVSPAALVRLKTDGVSEKVIAVMINSESSSGAPPVPARGIKISDGTEVNLKLLDRLSSASAKVNDRVRFEVVDDVTINGVVAIAKGAEGVGSIFEASQKKSFGRSGKLNFTIDAVKAIDGGNVRLRASKTNKGNESYGKAGVITILTGPFGALVKGKDVELEPGTQYTIYIDGDRTIQLK